MLIRLISLVILFIFLSKNIVYSEGINFVLPKAKPSIFKKIEKTNISEKKLLIPQNKPIQKSEKIEIIQDKVDVTERLLKNSTITIKKKITKKKTNSKFLIPQKKPVSYKAKSNLTKSSEILNSKDFETAKEVFKLIKAGKWNSAIKVSNRVKDQEFKNLVNWLYLKTTGNSASFSDYQKFITQNPDYPRIGRLQYLAEHKMYLRNNSPTTIVNWFNNYPPVSGMGKIKLAEAYIEQGKLDQVENLIKEGWINADIRKNDLGYYRAKFKKFLTTADHLKRTDFLAWERKYWDLKRMLRYLPKDEKALYYARYILMTNSYGVDKAISAVPTNLKNDPGLEYDRLKWRNRRGRLDGSLEILYKNSNKTEEQLVRPDLWWKQRESVVRSLIYKKKYNTAYKIASEHSLSLGPGYAEAEWLSGWLALSFLNSPEYAINHFQNFYSTVSYPISLSRGAYWLGKSYEVSGDMKNALRYFTEGSKFPTTFYGQLSFNEVKFGEDFILNKQTTYSNDYEKEFKKNRLIKHVFLLKELDSTKYAKDIIKHLATLNIDEGSEVLAAKLSTDIDRYDFAIQISKKASYEGRFINKYNYPIISTPRKINNKDMPDQELILAIIRQESEFDRKANSFAGARGMMQLMKYTAKLVAKQAKLPYSISRLTRDAEYNIKLGSYYFNSLLINYNGVYPFAIAAYNAGPNRVKTWRRVNGDPSKNELSYVNWIELIRFKETRNYVQRVLENVNVYKYVVSNKAVKIDRFFKE
jgi:soluble lytic murein transglycosylase